MDNARQIIPICMPKLGMEMTEGLLTRWHVAPGDTISRGDTLFEVETDKLSVEQDSEFEGQVRRILGEEGQTYDVGVLIAAVAAPEVPDADVDKFVAGFQGTNDAEAIVEPDMGGSLETVEAPAPEPSPEDAEQSGLAAPLDISPVAKRYAEEHGLDLSGLTGTGRLGRVSLADVKRLSGNAGTAPSASVTATPLARRLATERDLDLSGIKGSGPRGRIQRRDVENARRQAPVTRIAQGVSAAPSPMRKAIARRMVAAKATTPHIYLRREFSMGRLIDIRAEYNASVPSAKLTVTDFLIRAVALAQQAVPEANVQYHEDRILSFDQSDVSVAIATDAGLVSPVIPGADRREITDISDALRDLGSRAKARSLTAQDLDGGTITLTNLGMAGIRSFDAILNPPQALIVAFGATELRPANIGGELALDRRMDVTLSCDHRAIDGMVGAAYLDALGALIEGPLRLLGGGAVR